jgi:hypothetical protein
MGLDMYLSRKTYVKNYEHFKKEQKTSVSVKRGGKKIPYINSNRVSYVQEEVCYWRKANQIHDWFVQHAQGGEDDCKNYEVSRGQLEALLDTVNEVLTASKLVKGKIVNGQSYDKESKKFVDILEDGKTIEDPSVAMEMLPTASGFFFGGTDYDEYYIADLKHTKETLEKLLSETDKNDWNVSYEYTSSW